MHCFSILFTRRDRGWDQDDKIHVKTYEQSPEIFEVTYTCPELRTDRVFLTNFSSVLAYVEDSLTSMRHDNDPFEHIQVSTSIHPSVLYHVSDMDQAYVRDLILNMARDSMRLGVRTASR